MDNQPYRLIKRVCVQLKALSKDRDAYVAALQYANIDTIEKVAQLSDQEWDALQIPVNVRDAVRLIIEVYLITNMSKKQSKQQIRNTV